MEFKEVHKDDRREILSNTDLLEGKEVSIIKLNKGKAIGGCMHKNEEYYAIIKGSVIVSNGPCNMVCFPGDAGTFPEGTPHAFYANGEDCIIMEWGISPEEKVNSEKYEEMFNKVKEYNSLFL